MRRFTRVNARAKTARPQKVSLLCSQLRPRLQHLSAQALAHGYARQLQPRGREVDGLGSPLVTTAAVERCCVGSGIQMDIADTGLKRQPLEVQQHASANPLPHVGGQYEKGTQFPRLQVDESRRHGLRTVTSELVVVLHGIPIAIRQRHFGPYPDLLRRVDLDALTANCLTAYMECGPGVRPQRGANRQQLKRPRRRSK